jgi:undecaprenyl-phosphate 4-deoxy-4-formamido-L-arabinose transferase
MPNAAADASSLSVVIPVYNSAEILGELLAQLHSELQGREQAFEVILVDDDSSDESWAAIEALSGRYPWVRGHQLRRNFGQHNALLLGIRQARYPLVVTMDDDLQHPPAEISTLLAKLDEGYDVVYGTPEHEQHGLLRNLASQVTKAALQGAMGAETARKVSAFRAFRSELRDAFARYESPFVSIDVLLTWGTTRFTSVSIPHQPRHSGVSNYTTRKLLVHAVNMITGFSVLPLQLASLVGFAFTIFGAAVFVFVIGRYLIEGTSVPGFPFLASVITVFAGAQLFGLGIIGEYLARMYYRSMGRPTYAVRTRTRGEEQGPGDGAEIRPE